MRIAVDAMGGDHAPQVVLGGNGPKARAKPDHLARAEQLIAAITPRKLHLRSLAGQHTHVALSTALGRRFSGLCAFSNRL